MEYTVDELINLVKLYAAIPAQQPAYNNTNLLKYINTEYKNNIYPLLIQLNNEYFVAENDTTITGASQTIPIPADAIGQNMRDIKIIDGDDYIEVPRLEIDTLNADDFGFYFRGNNVYLKNADNYIGKTLRIYYYERPSDLVLTTSAAKVATVGATTYTVVAVPTAFGTSASLDFIKATPAFDTLATSIVTTIASVTCTPATFYATVSVGDYLCLAGQTCVVQLPAECFDLMAQAVVLRVLESQGDNNGLQVAQARYDRIKQGVISMLAERVVGEQRKIIKRNSLFNGMD